VVRDRRLHIAVALAVLLSAGVARAEVVLAPAIAADPYLQDMRRAMLAGATMPDADLRTLADAGEGLAAARFAQRLEERGDPAVLDDAAHYYSIAVYVDRDFALPRLLAILRRSDAAFGPARLRNIREVLDREAKQGNPVAAAGLADLLMLGRPFDRDVPRARNLLMVAAEAGDAKAAMRLAISHFQGAPGLPPDPEAARPALALALDSPDPGVQSMALTLGRRLPGGTALVAAAAPAEAATPGTELAVVVTSQRPRARPPAILEGAAP
jgi:TPR repeat protein